VRKILVLFLCLICIFSGHSVNLFSAYQEASEPLNVKTHCAQPWKVHDIAKDFELLDVWEFPILADKSKGQDFSFFLEILQQRPKVKVRSFLSLRTLISRSLVLIRWLLGEILGLDKQVNTLPIPGCKETSLKDRLSAEERKRSVAKIADEAGNNKFAWRTVYLYENEMLTELSNETAHALMHLGWIHKTGNFHTAQLAVYSKPRGDSGAFYMKLIMPFRRLFVYPALMDEVKTRWDAYNKINQKQSYEEWEKKTFRKQPPEKVMDAAEIKAGMIIGEVGAGRGRFTVHLANRVGPKGKILANDIDGEGLDYLRERCFRAGIINVETILGDVDDPHFPEGALDMVFMVWTYHFFDQPIAMLKKLLPTLKPGGTMVLVEPDPIRGPGGPDHGISPERMRNDASKVGLKVVRIEDFLPEDLIFILKPHDH
jgi:SAM-dependent methyltransferase